MKVLLITGSFPPMKCGVGDYTSKLASALAQEQELQIAVLTSRETATLASQASFALFPVIEKWDWHELSIIFDVIRTWTPDIVHIQYPTLGYGRKLLPQLLPLLLRISGIAVVQTWHEIHPFRLDFSLLSKGLVSGSLIVVREDYRRRTSPLMRWIFLNKTIRYIPNATSIPVVELGAAEKQMLRDQYTRPNVANMIVFFGFIYPRKGVDLLFHIADASNSHLVIIGDMFREAELRNFSRSIRAGISNHYQLLKHLTESETWRGKVTMSGFLPADEAARVIAAADAVVLPIRGGAGEWNTSVHAAQAQGTFVLTTSKDTSGYIPEKNTYLARESDLNDMREGLKRYVGTRRSHHNAYPDAWQTICKSHIEIYQTQSLTEPKQ